MEKTFLLGLIQNTAILLSFSMLYDYFWTRRANTKNMFSKVGSGIITGCIGIVLILTPWIYKEGLIFDTRSVLLSISGLFFGHVPTFIAMIIVGGYRFFLGGPGMLMGIAVVFTSGTIGLLWRYLRPNWQRKNYILELAAMGIIVHIVMFCCTLLLPSEYKIIAICDFALPIITVYPIATVLLGILMMRQKKNYDNKIALKESERYTNSILQTIPDFIFILDANGIFLDYRTGNPNSFTLPKERFINKNVLEVLPTPIATLIKDKIDSVLKSQTISSIEYQLEVKTDMNNYECFILPFGESKVLAMVRDITARKKAEIALKNSQKQLKKYAAHLQKVREEERMLLAREIHDELGQILIALKIEAGILKQKVKKECGSNDQVDAEFQQVFNLLDRSLKTTRKIMTDLRPAMLELLGLSEAAKVYLTEFEERYKIKTVFKSDLSDVDINVQASIALFRILQEALTNVAKHAQATEVKVVLGNVDNKIILEIIDNGLGFDKSQSVKQDAYGLIGMRERVLFLDGTLIISGEKNVGTRVRIEMPVSN